MTDKTPAERKKTPDCVKQTKSSRAAKPARAAKMPVKSLFQAPPSHAVSFLQRLDSILQDLRPLSGKQLRELPKDIRELSHQLTDERSQRRLGYMNNAASLSAYSHYFLPWSLFRLTRVFSALEPSCFDGMGDGSVMLDIGSGPLTVPVALWLSRPELRAKKLTFYCTDLSQSALAFGEELFLAAAAHTALREQDFAEPWKIVRVRDSFGVKIKQKADFVFCVNMCNELYMDVKGSLEEYTKRIAATLLDYGSENSLFFVAEPGVPRSSRFISLLRGEFLSKNLSIELPCPHNGSCPMPGRRGGKWCHFVLDTDEAPKTLHELSVAAGLPKDRAAISFVLARRSAAKKVCAEKNGNLVLRIVSQPIRLPYGAGRYACSCLGLTLACGKARFLEPGSLVEIPAANTENSPPRDKKSGAYLITI